LANIRQDWKCLQGTNTLIITIHKIFGCKKFYNIGPGCRFFEKNVRNLQMGQISNEPEGVLLSRSSRFAAALSVTKFIANIVID
jgi:hypothetical protein